MNVVREVIASSKVSKYVSEGCSFTSANMLYPTLLLRLFALNQSGGPILAAQNS